jgi:hypothetical protein
LKNIANNEIKLCHNAIESLRASGTDIDLKVLYNDIAFEKYKKAMNTLETKVDYKAQTYKEQKKAFMGIYEGLAAIVSNNALVKNKNADPKQVNYYTILERMNGSVGLANAVANLVKGETNKSKIIEMMKTENLNNKNGIAAYLNECGINLAKDFIPKAPKTSKQNSKINKIDNNLPGI